VTGETRRGAINWRQAGGEGLLIFLGVVVALLGQAWWEDRSEQLLVQDHAASLLQELEAVNVSRSWPVSTAFLLAGKSGTPLRRPSGPPRWGRYRIDLVVVGFTIGPLVLARMC